MKTIQLNKDQECGLIVMLNTELRTVTGPAAHPLNEMFRQLVGRDHDVYIRYWPKRAKPNEPWYQPVDR